MYQQLWGYKVEEKLYLGVREQKRLNTTALKHCSRFRNIHWLPKGSDESYNYGFAIIQGKFADLLALVSRTCMTLLR
jgi:hypothetical protein